MQELESEDGAVAIQGLSHPPGQVRLGHVQAPLVAALALALSLPWGFPSAR